MTSFRKIKAYLASVSLRFQVVAIAVGAVVIMLIATIFLATSGIEGVEGARSSTGRADGANAEVRVVSVAVIGDSYTTGTVGGGNGSSNWVSIVAKRLEDSSRIRLSVEMLAVGGSGYTRHGAGRDRSTFVDRASLVHPGTELVIFFGSRNDGIDPSKVPASADQAFRVIRESDPTAAALIIGAPWVDSSPPTSIGLVNDYLSTAAAYYGFEFLNPVDWIASSSLVAADGVHPNDAGHRVIADHMYPAVREVLSRMDRNGRSCNSCG